MNIYQINKIICSSRRVLVNGQKLIHHSMSYTSTNKNKVEPYIKLDISGAPSGWVFIEDSAAKKAVLVGASIRSLQVKDDEGRELQMLLYPWPTPSKNAQSG